jgi:hypothetical protein
MLHVVNYFDEYLYTKYCDAEYCHAECGRSGLYPRPAILKPSTLLTKLRTLTLGPMLRNSVLCNFHST